MGGNATFRNPLHVLVVEDLPDEREQLRSLLKTNGFRVDVAVDGFEMVRTLRRVRPDVVLVDLGLPGMDGFDAIRTVRALERQAANDYAPHIIVLSALGDADSRRRAFDVGCNQYLVKPADVRGALECLASRTAS